MISMKDNQSHLGIRAGLRVRSNILSFDGEFPALNADRSD